jgi:SOS regulatory protein LexA
MQTYLTPKQKVALNFITKFSSKNDYSPTLREIAKHIGKSLSSAQHFVGELQNKGYLQKEDNITRGISPINKNTSQIFKLGYISAGNPIDPIENPEPVDVPASLLKTPGNYYALEVKGNSMIEDNILNGDMIVVRHQKDAQINDIIIAITDDQATLKHFGGLINGKVKLIPKNSRMNPMYVDPETFEIRGKFVGLIRNA